VPPKMCQQFFLALCLFGHFLNATLNLSTKQTEITCIYKSLVVNVCSFLSSEKRLNLNQPMIKHRRSCFAHFLYKLTVLKQSLILMTAP